MPITRVALVAAAAAAAQNCSRIVRVADGSYTAAVTAFANLGVLPARGLGGDRRRRGLSNGDVGGVIENYHIDAILQTPF